MSNLERVAIYLALEFSLAGAGQAANTAGREGVALVGYAMSFGFWAAAMWLIFRGALDFIRSRAPGQPVKR
jgi:hypothetical protein